MVGPVDLPVLEYLCGQFAYRHILFYGAFYIGDDRLRQITLVFVITSHRMVHERHD